MDASDINENQLSITLKPNGKVLSLNEIKIYYRTVKENIPSGLISGVQVLNPTVGKKSATLIHRKVNDTHLYIIPLTRNLLSYEASAVKKQLKKVFDFKYDLFYSETGMVPAAV